MQNNSSLVISILQWVYCRFDYTTTVTNNQSLTKLVLCVYQWRDLASIIGGREIYTFVFTGLKKQSISKKVARAEHEYTNIQTPPITHFLIKTAKHAWIFWRENASNLLGFSSETMRHHLFSCFTGLLNFPPPLRCLSKQSIDASLFSIEKWLITYSAEYCVSIFSYYKNQSDLY